MCLNVHSKLAAGLIIGAVGQENWEVEIKGRASHAGVAPEKGISAMFVAAVALAEAHRDGWFGKVVTPEGHGTSNPGIFGGKNGKAAGDATNVVTDYVHIKGETRSPESAFAAAITEGYRQAFAKAQAQIKDAGRATAKVKFSHKPAYPPFKLADDAPVLKRAKRAATALGLTPTTLFSNGGLDANWFDKDGVPTVTIGSGQYKIHTVHE
jgi:tripeptide aminopeptidase